MTTTQVNMILIGYFVILAVYGIVEVILQKQSPNWKSLKNDKVLILLFTSFYLSVYLAPLEFILIKPTISSGSIISGFLILITGIVLRFIGLSTLGKNFSATIEIKEESKLIVNGIYKYIRHPLYLATLLIAISGCIVFSCLFTWVFVILTLVGVVLRIKSEEDFLSAHFQEFGEYKKRTHKLIPFVY